MPLDKVGRTLEGLYSAGTAPLGEHTMNAPLALDLLHLERACKRAKPREKECCALLAILVLHRLNYRHSRGRGLSAPDGQSENEPRTYSEETATRNKDLARQTKTDKLTTLTFFDYVFRRETSAQSATAAVANFTKLPPVMHTKRETTVNNIVSNYKRNIVNDNSDNNSRVRRNGRKIATTKRYQFEQPSF